MKSSRHREHHLEKGKVKKKRKRSLSGEDSLGGFNAFDGVYFTGDFMNDFQTGIIDEGNDIISSVDRIGFDDGFDMSDRIEDLHDLSGKGFN